MPGNLDDLGYDDTVEPGTFDVNPVDLETQHRQLVLQRLRIEVRIDPFPQPGLYDLHGVYLNCRRKRRSFSKNVRRSVTP